MLTSTHTTALDSLSDAIIALERFSTRVESDPALFAKLGHADIQVKVLRGFLERIRLDAFPPRPQAF